MATELSFQVAGQTFRVDPKSVEARAVRARIADAGRALDGNEVMDRLRERTTAVVVPDDRDRWVKLMDSDAIPFATLRQVEAWMLEFSLNRQQRRRRMTR